MSNEHLLEAAPLIADAETGQAAVLKPIELAAVAEALKTQTKRALHYFPRVLGPGPSDARAIAQQGWTVLYPDTPHGKAALAQLEPLVQLRCGDRACDHMSYKPLPLSAEPFAQEEAATTWISKERERRNARSGESKLPYYVLILGDFSEVPLALQQQLATHCAVGRLCFQEADAYRRYAQKVCHFASRPQRSETKIFTYVVNDSTGATKYGQKNIVAPFSENIARRQARGGVHTSQIGYVGTNELVQTPSQSEGSILISVSHGAGRPKPDWANAVEMRRLQGAPVIRKRLTEHDRVLLDPVEFATQPFLPGGVWFYLACFGGGTPDQSNFATWLSSDPLIKDENLQNLSRQLPRPGEGPFVGAVPQQALANPEGPLALIAHVDLAWSYGFWCPNNNKRYVEHLCSFAGSVADGEPVGWAFSTSFQPRFQDLNDQLLRFVERKKHSRPIDDKEFAERYLQRHDLRGYMLFGDPAASLNKERPGRV